ncbi:MAG: putative drug exporter of the superfamily [Thermoleophilaceae bacterium]|nr:putative drug exporter of the superfamily [Thermoleophilaceae bacterium]
MQNAMDRLEGFVARRGKWVLATWIVLLAASLPFTVRQTDHLTSGGFEAPGSGSATVDGRLASDFPGTQRETLAVVLRRRGGDAAAVRRTLERVERATAKVPNVSLDPAVRRRAEAAATQREVLVVPLKVAGSSDRVADASTDLRKALDPSTTPRDGIELHLVGQQALWAGMQDLTKEDLAAAEQTGFPIVLIILLAVFGSLAAAMLPLALGFGSVAVTGAAIYFLSQATQMSVFVTNVASMIGIGVAVDYSLFVLARYREEVQAGREPAEARRIAMRTSGVAVAFSGVTVMISLAGLFLVDSTTIRSMAMGAIVVVAISVLAAVTLLPALMKLLGRRAYSRGRVAVVGGLLFRSLAGRRRRTGRSDPAIARPGFWQRWTGAVTRRPVVAARASAAVLLVLAIPALSLKWGDGALRQFPKDNETRVGAELAAKATGPGASGPTQVILHFDKGRADGGANARVLKAYATGLRRDREVAGVPPPRLSPDGRAALIAVTARHDPESPQARSLLGRLRADAASGRGIAARAGIDIGGTTAHVEDFQDLVAGSLWKIALFVMGFSYVVLLILLRSALLPLKAVLMNLLSVGAAYGVLVAVFQWGWLDGLTGYDSLGYINSMTPALLLAITFGLSMDYEVFLLTRIKERFDATGDTRSAVAQGLAASARTITSAALIMVAVFAVFAGVGAPSIKEIGLGLAVAIALDATLVRLVLVPATMELLGAWNWWLPRGLARVLPHADFEGAPGGDGAAGAAGTA